MPSVPTHVPQCLLRGIAVPLMKLGFRLEVRGKDHLRQLSGPIILAGNHTGYLDSLIVLAAVNRPFKFLMSDEVYSWKSVGKFVRCGNIIPIDRTSPRQGLKRALDALKSGTSLCIFPEGTLTQTGELGRFNPGVAYLQQKTGLPVLPFTICGGFEAWAVETPRPRFEKLIIQFGQPLYPADGLNADMTLGLLRDRIAHPLWLRRPIQAGKHTTAPGQHGAR